MRWQWNLGLDVKEPSEGEHSVRRGETMSIISWQLSKLYYRYIEFIILFSQILDVFEAIIIKTVKLSMSDTEIITLSSLSPESSHSLILLVSVDNIILFY